MMYTLQDIHFRFSSIQVPKTFVFTVCLVCCISSPSFVGAGNATFVVPFHSAENSGVGSSAGSDFRGQCTMRYI